MHNVLQGLHAFVHRLYYMGRRYSRVDNNLWSLYRTLFWERDPVCITHLSLINFTVWCLQNLRGLWKKYHSFFYIWIYHGLQALLVKFLKLVHVHMKDTQVLILTWDTLDICSRKVQSCTYIVNELLLRTSVGYIGTITHWTYVMDDGFKNSVHTGVYRMFHFSIL